MINNHNYYILVNKGLLIPKSVSRNIINFINLKNKDYAINDLRVSKYLTYEELKNLKKEFLKFKKKFYKKKENSRNYAIYKFISSKYSKSKKMYERLSSNTAKKINGYIPSLSTLLLQSKKINKINHDRKSSIEIFNSKLKKFLIDCDFTKPDKNMFKNLSKVIHKYKNKTNKQIIFFSAVCPDYSTEKIGNIHRYTFDSIKGNIGLGAKRIIKSKRKIEKFFNTNRINSSHIISVGDFEAFSKNNQERLKLSEKEILSEISNSQEKINEAFKKYKFLKSQTFTKYFGGKNNWLKTKKFFKEKIKNYDFGNSKISVIKFKKILKSRLKLYKRWYGDLTEKEYEDILIDQAAEYASMGYLIENKFKDAIIIGADHHRMIDFYLIKSNIVVIYLKKNYET